jgi:hypothetical protein
VKRLVVAMPTRLDEISPMSNADVLLTIEGLPGYWSEFSGIKKQFSRPEYSDGLSNTKRVAASGTIKFDQVTLAKAHDPERDDAVFEFLNTHECGEPFDMSVRPVKRCKGTEFRGNKAWSLSGCRLMEWSVLENTDTASGEDVSKIQIVFSVEGAVFGGAKSTNKVFEGI